MTEQTPGALEENVSRIVREVSSVSRTLALGMLSLSISGIAIVCSISSFNVSSLPGRLGDSAKNQPRYELRTENLIGNSEPETFYEINGQRAYVEIDGKRVEDYAKWNPKKY